MVMITRSFSAITHLSLNAIAKLSLAVIAHNSHLLQHIETLPNPEDQFNYSSWEDFAEFRGWRIQTHPIFGNYRLLNPDQIRKGWWFEEKAMVSALLHLLLINSGVIAQSQLPAHTDVVH